MTTRLYYTSASVVPEPIEELAVVRLIGDLDLASHGRLPEGSLGAIVLVHDKGAAYEVEFTDPFAAVVTLRRDEIEPTETTRASVANAVDVRHRRRRSRIIC